MLLVNNFCEETINAWKLAGTFINILKIFVPLLVIVTGTIPFINAATKGTAEELFAAGKRLFFKLIASLIIFLAPTIIPILIEEFSGQKENSDMYICTSCIKNPNEGECAAKSAYNPDEIDEKGNVISGELKTGDLTDVKKKKEKKNKNNSDNNSNNNSNSNSDSSSDNSSNTNTNGNLTERIQQYINDNSAGGTWSVYVKNLSNGETVNINSGNKMISASIIKLFIMASAYDQISKHNINETPSLHSSINSMITVSSNDATNTVINSIPGGMNTVNNYNNSNGYSSTSLNRYLGGNRNPENYTSAKDVGNLLEKIYKKQLPHSDDMLNMLKNQQVRHKIPSGISGNVVVANKTGELSDVENDSAIVFTGGDYILVVLSQGVNNTGKAQQTVKGVSSIVYDNYK